MIDTIEDNDFIECVNDLIEIQKINDKEMAHEMADKALCEFIRAMGFEAIVTEYNKIEKWCA